MRLEEVSSLITEELENMAQVKNPDQITSKRKALIALFPFAVWWNRGGDHRMFDSYHDIFVVPKARKFVAKPIIMQLKEASPNSPNWAVTLMLPYADWGLEMECHQSTVTSWAGAALALQYTEELGQGVVGTLLVIASIPELQPLIPVNIWAWLKKLPSLPPICHGRLVGTRGHIVRRVQELGGVELLESYFLLVWSEWDYIYWDGLAEMGTLIREEFGGIGMWHHRDNLIRRLDCVLKQLDRGLGHLKQQKPSLGEHHIQAARERYGELKELLLEVDKEALRILTRSPFRLFNMFNLLTQRMSTESHLICICALPLPCP